MAPTIEFDGDRRRRRRAPRLRRPSRDRAPTSPSRRIVTPYPGPRAQAVIERMRAVEGAGPRTGGDDPPLVVESAAGSILTDPDGNRFVDLAAASRRPPSATPTRRSSRPSATRSAVLSHVSSASIERAARRVRGGAPRHRPARPRSRPARPERLRRQRHGGQAGADATGRREVIAFSGGYFGRGQRRHRARRQGRVPRGVGREADAHFLPYPVPVSLAARPGRRAGDRRSRSSVTPSRTRRRGSARSPPSSSSRSRATAASSSRPTGSWPACASWPTGTASSSSSTRSSAGSGGPAGPWAAEHWGVVPGPDDRRQGHRRRAGGLGGRRSRARS